MIRLTILLLALSCWSHGQEGLYPHAPNLTSENLKGSVRSIEEKGFIGIEQNGEYVASRPGWEHPWQTDTKSVFDSQGNLIKVEAFVDGSIESSTVYTYKNGKLIESFLSFSHHVFEYDSLDRITVEHYESTQPAIIRSGNEAPLDEATRIKINYIYDASGNLVIKKAEESEYMYWMVDSIFYDERNRPIKILSYDEEFVDFQIIQYDSMDNILQLVTGDTEVGLREKNYYTYVNNQLTVENSVYFQDSRPNNELIYYYENGNEVKCTEEELYDNSMYIVESSYEFDEKGNWIKKTIKVSDDENVYVITRTIEYY